jgi:hypothetical protein
MPTYQKKPVKIQAFCLTREAECPQWFRPEPGHITDGGILIITLEGIMLAEWGDYVIQGIEGEIYPCKPSIFEATYSLVNGPNIDQNAYILEGINDLRYRVNVMEDCREKSIMITKLDELRHWNEDQRLRKHYEGGGV